MPRCGGGGSGSPPRPDQPADRPTHLAKAATVMSRRLSPIIWGNILPGNSLLIGARCNYERKRAADRATSAICPADPEDRQFLIPISRCLNHLRTLRHALNNLIRQVSDILRWCALDFGTTEPAVRYSKCTDRVRIDCQIRISMYWLSFWTVFLIYVPFVIRVICTFVIHII